MAGLAQRKTGPSGQVHRRGDPGASDIDGFVWAPIAAGDRADGKPVEVRFRLVVARPQHPVAPPDRSEHRRSLSAQHECIAPVDRQHKDQICGRRGVGSPMKHGPSKPRQRRNVHRGIEADPLEIRAHCGDR